jgi:hypothetical protein
MVSTFRHHTDINTCKIFYTDVYPRETYSGKGFVLVIANQDPKHMCGYGILGLAFTTVEGVSTPCMRVNTVRAAMCLLHPVKHVNARVVEVGERGSIWLMRI